MKWINEDKFTELITELRKKLYPNNEPIFMKTALEYLRQNGYKFKFTNESESCIATIG